MIGSSKTAVLMGFENGIERLFFLYLVCCNNGNMCDCSLVSFVDSNFSAWCIKIYV